MCTYRGPAVLRKALDQFVSIKKNNVLLKMISWQGFRGSSRVRQQFSGVRRSLVERRPRVIKDKTLKNTTWLVLDHHPLYRTGRVSRAIRKMFEFSTACPRLGRYRTPCDQNPESQSHATCCDKVPEIHSHFVICCENLVGVCVCLRSSSFLVR